MKITDYAPRAAAMDFYLESPNLIGVEVGTDVGAHAEALLRYCSIEQLTLVDTWPSQYSFGYCIGRLNAAGFKNHIVALKNDSHSASAEFKNYSVDFVYIDILHDYSTVRQSLEDWWPKLKISGIIGYRNYAESNAGLKDAVDEFVSKHNLRTIYEKYHNEIILFK